MLKIFPENYSKGDFPMTILKAEDSHRLAKLLKEASHVVFFGGAGVSTESGIPDFRGNGGLYSTDGEDNAYYLSRQCLVREPEKFYEFYKRSMLYPNARPNGAHTALAELEKMGIIKAVMTQNIDGLHTDAGSKNVIELHGSSAKHYCMRCGKVFPKEAVTEAAGVPICDDCGGLIRPKVTLYGEALDERELAKAEYHTNAADLMIAAGSSLTVYPAAAFVKYFRGILVIINYSETDCDSMAELLYRDSVAKVLTETLRIIKENEA